MILNYCTMYSQHEKRDFFYKIFICTAFRPANTVEFVQASVEVRSMNTTSCFFTADYRDGQVYYAGKKYPAGHFTVQLTAKRKCSPPTGASARNALALWNVPAKAAHGTTASLAREPHMSILPLTMGSPVRNPHSEFARRQSKCCGVLKIW